jgi:hypothetical protein|tara:strand:- start:812 stop:991 length:180 start_codon:yes stop_codon:yes gene_type:complete
MDIQRVYLDKSKQPIGANDNVYSTFNLYFMKLQKQYPKVDTNTLMVIASNLTIARNKQP